MIVEIAGLDGVGKTTLMANLRESLLGPIGHFIKDQNFKNGRYVFQYYRREFEGKEDWFLTSFGKILAVAAGFDLLDFHERIHASYARTDLVVLDRFVTSAMAHLYAVGLHNEADRLLGEVAQPDLVLWLHAPLNEIERRLARRGDLGEDETRDFLAVQESCYAILQRKYQHRIHLIDAGASQDDVCEQALRLIRERLPDQPV